jgi:hydroxymethylbilane synthase
MDDMASRSVVAPVQEWSIRCALAVRVATRGSPLALIQTQAFIERLRGACPVLSVSGLFARHIVQTTGDRTQDRSLADIGGKGLFAKEIHEALAEGKVDFGVHSLKDLETCLPPGIALGCVLRREDARDALVVRAELGSQRGGDPYDLLPMGSAVGSNSARRQAQLLHERPDLRPKLLRGNVQTRLSKLLRGEVSATFLAMAGLRRSGLLDVPGALILPLAPERMVPAAGQGMIAITVREDDTVLRELLALVEDPEARTLATAERALLAELDGSCRTPIGSYARFLANGHLHLSGLVARADGSFLLKRSIHGEASAAALLGATLGRELRAESPADIFR